MLYKHKAPIHLDLRALFRPKSAKLDLDDVLKLVSYFCLLGGLPFVRQTFLCRFAYPNRPCQLYYCRKVRRCKLVERRLSVVAASFVVATAVSLAVVLTDAEPFVSFGLVDEPLY